MGLLSTLILQHGLLTIQCGGAGTHEQSHREEAGMWIEWLSVNSYGLADRHLPATDAGLHANVFKSCGEVFQFLLQ